MTSVFAQYHTRNYPHRYHGQLTLTSIAGGVPLNPTTLEGHIKRKIDAPDNLIRAHVNQIMLDRADQDITVDQAVEEAAKQKGWVGFTNEPGKGLWIPGANLKACIIEAACIAAAAGRIKAKGWGETSSNKGIRSWLAEHIFIENDRLYLGVTEPTEVNQSFIHKMGPRGATSAIQYTEIIRNTTINFHLETDHHMTTDDWAAIWTTAETNGLGASRKRGYGTFQVTQWIDTNNTPNQHHQRQERAPTNTRLTTTPPATTNAPPLH
jgi:hypothetical protein